MGYIVEEARCPELHNESHNMRIRYANRAKNIKNKPKINEDPKDTMIREFQEEIARLKAPPSHLTMEWRKHAW